MKRFFNLILTSILCLSLAGCSSAEQTTEILDEPVAKISADVIVVGGGGAGLAAAAGAAESGASVIVIEAAGYRVCMQPVMLQAVLKALLIKAVIAYPLLSIMGKQQVRMLHRPNN